MEGDIRELARHLNKKIEEVQERVKAYTPYEMAAEWRRKPHETPEDVRRFYEETDLYLYELVSWNATEEFRQRVHPLLHYRGMKILEIGAGIGSLCIALALNGNDVTYCDINDKLTAFAKQRFADRLLDIKSVKSLRGLRDYDIVVAIDTLEHIHPDELPKMLKDIAGCLKDGGFLYERSNFWQQDLFPMHYDYSTKIIEWCEKAGLVRRNNGDFQKGAKTQGVQLAVPSRGQTSTYFTRSLMNLSAPQGTILTTCDGYPVDLARNKIVKQIRKDWLFFMDDDQAFPPQTLEHLLRWNVDIVSGIIFKKTGEPIPMVYKYCWEEGKGHYYQPLCNEVGEYLMQHRETLREAPPAVCLPQGNQLLECDGVSCGCLLVNRRVFETLEEPWFKCDEGSKAGEDFYFCRKAQEAGFKIYADPSVLCGHFGEYQRGHSHFWSWAMKGPYPWTEEPWAGFFVDKEKEGRADAI